MVLWCLGSDPPSQLSPAAEEAALGPRLFSGSAGQVSQLGSCTGSSGPRGQGTWLPARFTTDSSWWFPEQFHRHLMRSCKNPRRRKVFIRPIMQVSKQGSQLVSLEPQLDLVLCPEACGPPLLMALPHDLRMGSCRR